MRSPISSSIVSSITKKTNKQPIPQPIDSLKSPIIKTMQELRSAKGRTLQKEYWAEGTKLLERALTFGASIKAVLVTERWLEDPSHQPILKRLDTIPLYQLSCGLMSKLSSNKPTPDCIVWLAQTPATLSSLSATQGLLLMTERVINIDNLGMMLRSAEACGVDGVLLCNETADPYHPRTVRASCGAVYKLPLCVGGNVVDQIHALKPQHFQVVATSANEGVPYHSLDFTQPTMLLVGNEQVGLTREAKDAADVVAHIPMMGLINSLNVAVATSIVMYEAVKQRCIQAAPQTIRTSAA